jgi:glycerol-3-phosphate dehydrogenase
MNVDLLVVGGGINGAGIARDAVGRGFKVALCEQHDLAAHTSSASTKLIHGGLRYLEFFHFGLVRKALLEREVLMALAPHIIRPMRFVMPHASHLRPAWMIRCGLFLYDHLARRRVLPGSARIRLQSHAAGAALATGYRTGFTYYDAWVDDARLVVLNAMAAASQGARVMNYRRVDDLRPAAGGWLATLAATNGVRSECQARAVVNATGPWAAQFRRMVTPGTGSHGLRLVKGSHIIVRRLFDHDDAYIFQANDRRVVFAIPYEDDFTLVGTTDVDYTGPIDRVSIDAAEVQYLCAQVNLYFRQQIGPTDVLGSYSGVRPLLADESSDARSVNRDYHLEFTADPAPMLNVFGGKITTYRVLAEQAVNLLCERTGRTAPAWTHNARLPGGELPAGGLAAYVTWLRVQYPWLPPALAQRYARSYGSLTVAMLRSATRYADLGAEILPQLHSREVQYLRQHEFAVTAEDILWRRSKLGLHLPATAAATLQSWMDGIPATSPGATA